MRPSVKSPMSFTTNWLLFGMALAPWAMAAVYFPREAKKDAQRLQEILCDSAAKGSAEF